MHRGHFPNSSRGHQPEAITPSGSAAPKTLPQGWMGVGGELFIELLGLEPGLQLLGGGAVVPLLAAGAAVEQYPTAE